MHRSCIAFLILMVFASFAYAQVPQTYDGDGTYMLFAYDKVISDNGFTIFADTFLPYGAPTQLFFSVSYGGEHVESVTLSAGETRTVRHASGNEVDITVLAIDWVGNEERKNYYADMRVASIGAQVGVTDFYARPDQFGAEIFWTTNKDAKGTVSISGPGLPFPSRNLEQTDFATSQSVVVDGLESNTEYMFRIMAFAAHVSRA